MTEQENDAKTDVLYDESLEKTKDINEEWLPVENATKRFSAVENGV